MKRIFRLTAYQAIVVLVFLALALWGFWRNVSVRRTNELYLGARTFTTRTQDVDSLASIKSPRTHLLLLQLAKDEEVNESNREEAIKQLSKATDPETAAALSNLLQPFEGLSFQQEIATALRKMNCIDSCIANVLHYLERYYNGEHFIMEDVNREELAGDLRKDQQTINRTLEAILTERSDSTLGYLSTVYGIGTAQPAPFAVDLVARLRLAESCHALLKAQEWPARHAASGIHPRADIETAVRALGCQP